MKEKHFNPIFYTGSILQRGIKRFCIIASASLLLIPTALKADIVSREYIVRLIAIDVQGERHTYYLHYSSGADDSPSPVNYYSDKKDSLLYFDGFISNNTSASEDSILVADSVNYCNKIPYAVGRKIAKRDYISIEIDSVLEVDVTPNLQWVDETTAWLLSKKKMIDYYEVTLFDCYSFNKVIKICSFDSLWTEQHFIFQFKDTEIVGVKPQYRGRESVLYEGVDLNSKDYDYGSDAITFSLLPASIKEAIETQKIFIAYKDEY
ncbi:MAG: hypothetical protein JW801_04960 [Bacteroidales bacterium]|nr:hypothetical protein [Bacteroidales bacterium]